MQIVNLQIDYNLPSSSQHHTILRQNSFLFQPHLCFCCFSVTFPLGLEHWLFFGCLLCVALGLASTDSRSLCNNNTFSARFVCTADCKFCLYYSFTSWLSLLSDEITGMSHCTLICLSIFNFSPQYLFIIYSLCSVSFLTGCQLDSFDCCIPVT